jgi:DNA repair exonuclease SbcCD ATPase subunit
VVTLVGHADGETEFWIHEGDENYNIGERFDSLDAVCDTLINRTDINRSDINWLKDHFEGKTDMLEDRTNYLRGLINSRTEYLKEKQDKIIEQQGVIREDHEELEDRHETLNAKVNSLIVSTHNRIERLKQDIKDLATREDQRFVGALFALVLFTGILAAKPDLFDNPDKEDVNENEERIQKLEEENEELRGELNSIKESIETGDEN